MMQLLDLTILLCAIGSFLVQTRRLQRAKRENRVLEEALDAVAASDRFELQSRLRFAAAVFRLAEAETKRRVKKATLDAVNDPQGAMERLFFGS